MSKLQLTALTKKYDSGVLAVEDIHLTVENGAFCVLLGQEKSGKSSILRMIAGIETLTEGDILLDDVSIIQKPSKDRDIAMFFQANTLQQTLTIAENIAYGLKLRKENEALIEKKVHKIASICGIQHTLSKRPKALTTIERLKVILARAIVREPKLFLFDDPFANLAPSQKEEILQILVQLQLRFQFTAVYATDCVRDAFLLASHIAILKEGKVVQMDEALHLFENPANFYVADYLYTFNLDLKEGHIIQSTENQYAIEYDNTKKVLPEKVVLKNAKALAELATSKQKIFFAQNTKGVLFLFDENKNAI